LYPLPYFPPSFEQRVIIVHRMLTFMCYGFFLSGIPFGSVNLLHGVDKHESKVKQPSPIYLLLLEYVGLQPRTDLLP